MKLTVKQLRNIIKEEIQSSMQRYTRNDDISMLLYQLKKELETLSQNQFYKNNIPVIQNALKYAESTIRAIEADPSLGTAKLNFQKMFHEIFKIEPAPKSIMNIFDKLQSLFQ